MDVESHLAWVRSPTGLVERIIRRRHAFRIGPKPEDCLLVAHLRRFYEVAERSGSPPRELQQAWDALADVASLNEAVAGCIRRVLAGTWLGSESRGPLDPPRLPEDRRIATAAHPRAYRGTKVQPPKPATERVGDLRPHVCNRMATRRLLERMGQASSAAGPRLPVAFERALLPLVTPETSSEALSLYWSLSLESREDLLAAMAALFASAGAEMALAWGGVVGEVSRARQAVLVALVVESEAWKRAPDRALREALVDLSGGKHFVTRWYCLLSAWARGISAEYMRAGFELTGRAWLNAYGDCPEVPVERIRAIEGVWSWSLWMGCANNPALAANLRDDVWDCMDADTQGEYFSYSMGQKFAGAVNATIKRTRPAARKKAVVFAGEIVESMRDLPLLEHRLDRALAFVERLCAPPFDPAETYQRGLVALLGLVPDEHLDTFLNIADACLLRIEKACRRDNDEWRIARGMVALLRVHPDRTLDALLRHPKSLLATARELGSLKVAHAVQILRSRDGLPLRAAVVQSLAAPYRLSPTDHKIAHALAAMSQAGHNRRALKRFLRAWSAGERDYIWTHPLSRRWMKAHPALNLEAWRHGLLDADGPIRVAVEEDPLEALRLGTVVGTCVGLGGIHADSAPAVVLDINKQVLYARNERGVIVARQIVAIADDERLVCFEVYPDTAAAALFRDYDRRLAAAVGIPVHDGDSPYEIANVISKDWWDDGAWNLELE